MITRKFLVLLIIMVAIYLVVIYHMIKEHVTLLKYTLLWGLMGVILLLFAIFPSSVMWLANLFGIYSDTNFLFLFMIGFEFILLFSLTHIVSKQNENNKRLVQEIAILEKRVRELEQDNPEDGGEQPQ